MDKAYADTVRLLLAITPDVFANDIFALKGGTAINLFVRDMLLRPALISSHRLNLSEGDQGGVSHGNFDGTRTQGNAGRQGAQRASRTPRTTPPVVCAGGVYGR